MEIGHSCPRPASLLRTIGVWNMCAADEQNATSPPFELPDAFHLVTSALRPLSNIQCLRKSLDFGIQKKKTHRKTYLSIPDCSNFNNMTTVMRGDTWRWSLLKFRWLISVGLRVMCFLFLHLCPLLRVVPLHEICRVEHLYGKRKELTGVACPDETSAPSVRRSCNSTPSSFRPFRVSENGFLAHFRKRGWVGMSSIW
jgi:hypothetical protein